LAVGAVLGCTASAPGADRVPKVDFNFQIRPILSDKCFNCHGPDSKKRQANLRLDTKEGAFAASRSGGHIIVPGDLEGSELVWRITAPDEAERMPPRSLGRSLTSEEINLLKRWIEQGAEWKVHWSFLAPVAVVPPAADNVHWCRTPVDRFVLARLDAERLIPVREASRERLIRRLTFDLTGLPPSLAEVDAFLADCAPGAYERVVDRLLASPRFGERMAVDWLDLARYADTYGYQADVFRATWAWRDWVVQAFNSNLPYDQFITWQLAGDLLPDPGRTQVLATAFNRHHRQTNEGGSIEEEFRTEYVADRTNTFGTAFLGLTLECARCHNHKYDPITQKEYYQLFSFFNNIDESGLYSHFTDAVPTPTLLLATVEQDQAIVAIEKKIRTALAELDQTAAKSGSAFEAWLGLPGRKPVISGLIGDFPFDSLGGGKVANLADPRKPAQTAESPEPVLGRIGQAVRLSGENNVTLPLGNFDRFEPFSLAFWIQTPDHKDRAVIVHRSMAWTDAGSRGYQLLIEDGKLSAGLIHFWPGNAIAIRTRDPVPLGKWFHVALTYDGSSQASGLILYINGRRAACQIIRDRLTKNITGGGNDHLTIGQRFRDRGFKNGLVDEFKVFDRALTPLEVAQLHDQKTLVEALASGASKSTTSARGHLLAYYLATADKEYKGRLAVLKELRRQRSLLVDPVPETMVMKELPTRRPTFVLLRGVYDAPGERVEAGLPTILAPLGVSWPRNRLGLASWLTDPKHPLTARVAVNRWWQALWGRGLVATPEDFGSQGQLPSHPQLLDWLARRFVDSGWDIKRLVRLIVTSASYRQNSEALPELLAKDPDNVSLARGPCFRLPAEMIRDAALAASGLLVSRFGGPPVKPYQPPGLWEEKSGLTYERDRGVGSHRRSLYTFWKRTSPPPAMLTFDATTREVCAVKRQTTATPLQALVLLNDPQFVEAARVLAQRAAKKGGANLADRIIYVVRVLTSRHPSLRELATLEALYRDQYSEFRNRPGSADKLLAVGDAPHDLALDPDECAAMTVLVQTMLNHDEMVMRR
jgi:hypothetical protein